MCLGTSEEASVAGEAGARGEKKGDECSEVVESPPSLGQVLPEPVSQPDEEAGSGSGLSKVNRRVSAGGRAAHWAP